jgi:hypothetical protein
MNTRPDYTVLQGVTKTFGYGNFVRVKLENLPILSGTNGLPISVRIDNNPAVPLTQKQMDQISLALEFDETVQHVVALLEKRIIHGDPIVRKTLCKLFKSL